MQNSLTPLPALIWFRGLSVLLETVVTVTLSFSLLLRSRVTPRDRLRHPLSPLSICAPLLSSPFLPFFLFSLNLLLFVQLVIQVVCLLWRPLYF